MSRLDGKIAIVTGGANGIGAAVVETFAREGATVVSADIDQTANQSSAAATADRLGVEIHALPLDITLEDDWGALIDRITQAWGGVDVLVNNAGVGVSRKDGIVIPVDEMELAEWNRVMTINATGVFLGVKHVVAPMRQRGGGSIVNISSAAGIVGTAATAYSASKGAVRLLTKSVAMQLAPWKIRCNSVHPGMVPSALSKEALVDEKKVQAMLSRYPLGRFGAAQDIAEGCLYLASDAAGFVTGTELIIDGGMTAV
jgi:cyclopentanol dehydrogenase